MYAFRTDGRAACNCSSGSKQVQAAGEKPKKCQESFKTLTGPLLHFDEPDYVEAAKAAVRHSVTRLKVEQNLPDS